MMLRAALARRAMSGGPLKLRGATGSTAWQLDVRSGATDGHDASPIKWAFLSCGRVAHDFANALRCVEGAVPHVVATRGPGDVGRAEAFKEAHGFARAVGTYAEALADESVDVVYLSAMHSDRVAHVCAILDAGKHVVVEKPLALNARDGALLAAKARSKGLFMMEGMWTRCFPAVERARALMDAGAIGAVTSVLSDFGFDAADSGAYPADAADASDGDPIYHAAVGGGALLWAGPYPLAAGLLPFGAQAPRSVAAAGVVDPKTGVDLSVSVGLSYDAPGGAVGEPRAGRCPPRGATCSLFTAIDGETAETTTYVGTGGRITVLPPAHCPTRLRVEIKKEGRGSADVAEYDYALPEPRTPFALTAGGDPFHYPNSAGFAYEAAAVMRCLRAGLTELPQFPLDETLRSLEIADEAKRAIGATAAAKL